MSLFDPNGGPEGFFLVPDEKGELDVMSSADAGETAYSFVNGELRFNDALYEATREASTNRVAGQHWQLALDIFEQVDKKRDKWLDRSRVRQAMANKFRHEVFPATGKREYLTIADKLAQARPRGLYGVDTIDQTLRVQWFQRAGLNKYCPDDARDAARRTQETYLPRILDLMVDNCTVRYATATWPNVPRWHLAAALDGIVKSFRDKIFLARHDGKRARSIDDKRRVFPSLVGALACVEAPLSAHGDWNVHVNLILIFKPAPGDADNWRTIIRKGTGAVELVPDYEPLREAWGANIQFDEVPADPAAAEAALRELIKYPFKAISEKSADHFERGKSKAPPWLYWPVDAIHEWHIAHKGYRRTRSFGELHIRRCKKPLPRSKASLRVLGMIALAPSYCRVTHPFPAESSDLDSIIGAYNAGGGTAPRGPPGPPVGRGAH